jgi:hypothetical protein
MATTIVLSNVKTKIIVVIHFEKLLFFNFLKQENNMEKIINRDRFLENFCEYCNKLNLTEELIDILSKHRYFSDGMKTVLVRTNIF